VRATEEKKIGEDTRVSEVTTLWRYTNLFIIIIIIIKGREEWDQIKLGAKSLNVFVDSTMMALRFSR